MKKTLLLLIPAFMLLSACGSRSNSSSSSSSSSSSQAERQIEDITISLTVSGIDTYEEGHEYIYMNADALGSATDWGTAKMVQDEDNANLWTTVIEDFELEQSISYNFYYGNESSPDWTNGKNVIEDADYYTLVTEADVTNYALSAEFDVPEVTGTIDIEFKITPTIVETDGGEEKALESGVYVWAWNNLNNSTVVLTDNGDGTWSFTASDVSLLDGKATVQITPVLGTKSAADWSNAEDGEAKYKIGAWESGEWEPWGTGISYDFTSEDTTYAYGKAYFRAQPEIPATSYELTVTYVEGSDTTSWPSARWLVYSSTSSALTDMSWAVDLSWSSGNSYTATYSFGSETIYLGVGLWLSDANRYGGASTSTGFAITFTASEASIQLDFSYTAVASYYAGTASNAVGCTVA